MDDNAEAAAETLTDTASTAVAAEPWTVERVQALAVEYGITAAKALLILIVAYILAGWISGLVRRSLTKARVDETLTRFFAKLTRWGVIILGVVACLEKFGVEMMGFTAILAAAGFAIGMAMSGTLGNFASGVMLLVFRPFKVGDIVNTAGVVGKVHEIELFTTTLDTPDNRRLIVPNGSVFGSTIENVTHHPKRRIDCDVGTDYGADLDEVRKVLLAAANATPIKNDDDVQVLLKALGGSSIDWQVRVWAPTEDYWAAKDALTDTVKKHLDAADIGIPFPQMDVHLDHRPAE